MLSFLDAETERRHRRQNLTQTIALIGGIGLVMVISAGLIWGWAGVLGAAAVTLGSALFAPRIPPEAVMRLYSARPIDPRSGGQLNEIIDALTARAELPARPTLYVIPSMTLNAFATGSATHAAIGITEGLLRKLTLRELAGVLAHEISHIRNNDLVVMGLADVMTRLTQMMSYIAFVLVVLNLFAVLSGEDPLPWLPILLLYLAPTIASLLQLGLSRAREYDADREAATLTGDPVALASALRRLEQDTGRFWEDLMYPVPGRRVPQPSLLRSHPATSDRIARLLELRARMPDTRPAILVAEGPMISLVGLGPIEMRPRHRFPGIWY